MDDRIKTRKKLKKTLPLTNCDMKVVREWFKKYDVLVKKLASVTQEYNQKRIALSEVLTALKQLEQYMIQEKQQQQTTGQLQEQLKQLKRLQNELIHEFLVSKENTDFSSTYASVLTLGNQYGRKRQDAVILQSEIENLIALTEEILQQRQPDMLMYTYFTAYRMRQEMSDLPYEEKCNKVQRIFYNDFFVPMSRQLQTALQYALTMEGTKKAAKYEFLIQAAHRHENPIRSAEYLLNVLCKVKVQ